MPKDCDGILPCHHKAYLPEQESKKAMRCDNFAFRRRVVPMYYVLQQQEEQQQQQQQQQQHQEECLRGLEKILLKSD
jgi:hypothetical protein